MNKHRDQKQDLCIFLTSAYSILPNKENAPSCFVGPQSFRHMLSIIIHDSYATSHHHRSRIGPLSLCSLLSCLLIHTNDSVNILKQTTQPNTRTLTITHVGLYAPNAKMQARSSWPWKMLTSAQVRPLLISILQHIDTAIELVVTEECLNHRECVYSAGYRAEQMKTKSFRPYLHWSLHPTSHLVSHLDNLQLGELFI